MYVVQPEKGGKLRVLQRNLLLPCPFLPANSTSPAKKRQQKQPPRACPPVNRPQTLNVQPSVDSDEAADYPSFNPNQLNALAPCFSPQASTFPSGSPPDDVQDVSSEKNGSPNPVLHMDGIQGPSEESEPVSEPESICQPPDPLPVNSCGKSALSASPTTSCPVYSPPSIQSSWPQRNRRPPTTFTYFALSSPCSNVSINAIQQRPSLLNQNIITSPITHELPATICASSSLLLDSSTMSPFTDMVLTLPSTSSFMLCTTVGLERYSMNISRAVVVLCLS